MMAPKKNRTDVWIEVLGWERRAEIQHQREGFRLEDKRLSEVILVSHQWGCLARLALPRAQKLCESPWRIWQITSHLILIFLILNIGLPYPLNMITVRSK